mmetsp:Transcript_19162/g.31787  ORF Transcript_19162/g.31787 Transcript_19162/m.31787 type:complete len:369 (-) Transcript_19162:349-1455(-)|eukprot:CAMPEP_0119017906 /NCGR_PEP_ID=MMETSP1176-20130426/18031_1 /TAXON_ID=265551 /ORGANISM="Synedropsis recta cf, Strain CCMP1620" /LENGTH=368 /DNA_ID=CAMNT_0006971761 /DNA_START=171 /DNA_END=1277 /DNA_ORIENTATION=-
MIPRRRLYAESAPFEMDFSGRTSSSSNNNKTYSTFTSSNNNNNNNTDNTESSNNNNMPYWLTLLSAVLSTHLVSSTSTSSPSRRWTLLILMASILLVVFLSGGSSDQSLDGNSHSDEQQQIVVPSEDWYHNHYNGATPRGQRQPNNNRNLLIVQLSSGRTKSWSDVTSIPNRAYARQWAVDYLLHYSNTDDDDTISCPQSQLLWDIYQRRTKENDDKKEEPIYDAVLFLSSDAVITDLDYNLLTLLPEHQLVLTVTTTSSNNNDKLVMSLWNLRHQQFKNLARLYRDTPNCDASIWELAEEASMTTTATTSNNEDSVITTLSPSAAGFVEPRLVKFLLLDSKTPTILAKLQTTADSVCYRYYPRCDVL